jgi:hypothetical protein
MITLEARLHISDYAAMRCGLDAAHGHFGIDSPTAASPPGFP